MLLPVVVVSLKYLFRSLYFSKPIELNFDHNQVCESFSGVNQLYVKDLPSVLKQWLSLIASTVAITQHEFWTCKSVVSVLSTGKPYRTRLNWPNTSLERPVVGTSKQNCFGYDCFYSHVHWQLTIQDNTSYNWRWCSCFDWWAVVCSHREFSLCHKLWQLKLNFAENGTRCYVRFYYIIVV